jgi:hypothetical protein
MNKKTQKQYISTNSELLTQSEIDSLVQDMREAEIGMIEIIRSNPHYLKIKELIIEAQKYPQGSMKWQEICKEINKLQKPQSPNP